MTVQVAINEARVVLKRVQEIESTYPNVPGKSSWGSCVDYFNGIVYTLNMVLDQTLKPTPLETQTWISGGLTYINVCEKGFEMINIANTIVPVISNKLKELMLNSLAISLAIRGADTDTNTNTHGIMDWNFSDEYNLSNLALERPDVVVAKDGSGNYETIQEAVNSAGKGKGKRYVIYVKAGVYEENVKIVHQMEYIKMYGDGIHKTIVTGDRTFGRYGDLKETATFQVWGRGFIARDMTFRNTAGPEGQQAVALLSGSDQSVFYRCSIQGYQDTLYTFSSIQFYKECQIYGTVDFIFGDALAVFQDCEILFRKPIPGGGLVVTAHGRIHTNQSTGYSFQGCKITAATDLKPVIGQYSKAFLGRPWFPHASTVYMQSFIDDLVDPRGWLDNQGYKKTTFYGEYNNYGPGSSTNKRVKWHGYHVIKDPKIAGLFTVSKFISGNQWLPETGVPFTSGLKILRHKKSSKIS
ncbi:putative pectinesterase [Tanacetum coccineum]